MDGQTVTFRGYLRAQRRIGASVEARLRWAVSQFAATELPTRPAPRRARKEELLAFIGLTMFEPGKPKSLPSEEELSETHARFRQIIRSLTSEHRQAIIARGTVVVGCNAKRSWSTIDHTDEDVVATDAAVTLGRLLAREGHRVKSCPAPVTVGKEDPEPCGRWFVGRPNQRCCSPKCANRASTRAARFGQAIEQYRGAKIEVRSYQLPSRPGRWRPSAWITTPTDSTHLVLNDSDYSSKTRADQEVRRRAQRLVEQSSSSRGPLC